MRSRIDKHIDFSKGPLPDVENQQTAFFWEGTRQGEIRFPKCRECDRFHWYPSLRCPFCHSSNITWQALGSDLALYTWSYANWSLPEYGIRGPYILALGEFEEAPGLFLTSNLVDCSPGDVRIGMPLEVIYQRVNDRLTMPLFRPTGQVE